MGICYLKGNHPYRIQFHLCGEWTSWVDQNVPLGFPHVTEKPEWAFWPTEYILFRTFFYHCMLCDQTNKRIEFNTYIKSLIKYPKPSNMAKELSKVKTKQNQKSCPLFTKTLRASVLMVIDSLQPCCCLRWLLGPGHRYHPLIMRFPGNLVP